ncbi:MAG: ATP-binding protein [Lentisphaeria bacterium]|nr:ATP-binding protein [Lentisphaeria bacterium]
MRRTAEKELKNWFANEKRHPLVIRGARQVGKSTLVRDFATHEGLQLNEINLYRNLRLADVFKTLDPKRICDELSDFLSRDVRSSGTLLFLDEIQAIPEAIDALRYFYEEMPEFPVVTAGSLLEFTLAEHRFSMPVGRVEYMFLGPVTFNEFMAEANGYLAEQLTKEKISAGLSETAHKGLMELVRRFMLVGGMPEAAQAWLDSGKMGEVSAVHWRIFNTYIDDFAKYASGTDLALMQSIFRSIPAHVREKVKYVNYSREHKAAKIASAIDLFIKARIACPVVHSDCNGLPLGAEERATVRKLLFMDVGLMNYANGLTWTDLNDMDDTQLVNEGSIAEQFIGQHLFFRRGVFEEPRLNYWLREGKSDHAEVDYVIERGRKILPIEVKAGKAGSMKALRQMMQEKKLTEAMRFDASPYSAQRISVEDASHGVWEWLFTSVPLYGVEAMTHFD